MLRFVRHQLAVLTAAGFLAGSAFAGGEQWTEDFSTAQETAQSEGKDMILDFTGSDWCGWCIKLNEEVFSQESFQAYAPEHFVLVELDYPTPKVEQSEELKAQNAELKEKYAIRGYPTIFLADAQGVPYARTGYQAGGSDNYVEHLEELRQIRVNRDEQMDAAGQVEGVEKAGHLHEAMQAVGDDLALKYYEETVQQIMELDADNEAGLKQHYQDLITAVQQREAMAAIMQGARADAAGTLAALEEFLGQDDLVTAIRQEALANKSQILLFMLEDKPAAKATLEAAIAVDPESEMAERLRGAIARFFPEGE